MYKKRLSIVVKICQRNTCVRNACTYVIIVGADTTAGTGAVVGAVVGAGTGAGAIGSANPFFLTYSSQRIINFTFSNRYRLSSVLFDTPHPVAMSCAI